MMTADPVAISSFKVLLSSSSIVLLSLPKSRSYSSPYFSANFDYLLSLFKRVL